MKLDDKLKAQSKKYQEVVDACHYILMHEMVAFSTKKYINTRVSPDLQKQFGLGFFPSDDDLDCITSLVDKSLLLDLNLIYPKYISGGVKNHGHFHNHNLIMPFRDVYGNIVALLGRRSGDNETITKYKYTLNFKKQFHLFGLDLAKQYILKKNYVIVTEGQFDQISLWSTGINNVVAVGSSDMSVFQFFQAHRYTNNIVVMFDSDEAGAIGKKKLRRKYGMANFIGMEIPEKFKDIDEFIRKSQNEHLRNKVKDTLSLEWNSLEKEVNGQN